jgi:hypothetical protein
MVARSLLKPAPRTWNISNSRLDREALLSGLLIAISLLLALRHRAPANIERYLWSVLAEIPFLWVFAWEFGVWSVTYAVVYVLFTAIVLACICRIAIDCLRRRHYRLRAAAIAFLLAGLAARGAYLGMPRPITGYQWIALLQGMVLFWAGILVTALFRYVKRWDLVFPLGLFWLVQAFWNFGWTFHGHAWDKINFWVPPALGCVIFSLLAWRLRVTWATG